MTRHPYILRASSYFRLAEKARRARDYPQAATYQRIAEKAISDYQDVKKQQAIRRAAQPK